MGERTYRRSKTPTDCLYMTNLGKACCKTDREELLRAFRNEGIKVGIGVKDLIFGENSHSFLVFDSVEDCKRFFTEFCEDKKEVSVKGKYTLLGRKMSVEYTQRLFDDKDRETHQDYLENERLLTQKGLVMVKDFISQEEGKRLIEWLDTEGRWECRLKRRVQHYGHAFDYITKTISPDWVADIPEMLSDLAHRMLKQGLIKDFPDQITANEYLIGQGIGPHIDSHHTIGESIAVISLGSYACLDFYDLASTEDEGDQNHTRELVWHLRRVSKKSVFVPENSLYIMKGEIRYRWEHGIKARKTEIINGSERCKRGRRISITFRKFEKSHLLRDYNGHKCKCEYEEYCDSRHEFLRVSPDRVTDRPRGDLNT